MADATALGIMPPATVRIEHDDSYQDWPFDLVEVEGDRISISVTVGQAKDLPDVRYDIQERGVLYYPYEHAHKLPDGSWRFLGGIFHPEFIVRSGPPQPLAMDTAGPQPAHP